MKEDNIDKLIFETDKEIEKLKILKAKREELKQLESEIGVAAEPIIKPTAETKQVKTKKPVKPPYKLQVSSRSRKAIASVIAFSMISLVIFAFVTRVEAADPVNTAFTPLDISRFADTANGDGVNWSINISDADSNIALTHLTSNSSGSWAVFYRSGALGGVQYHNTTGQNGNWTGSWTTYWWNISVNDGTWHNTTYNFTTEYQWGDPQMAALDDAVDYDNTAILKNNTGEYYMFYENKITGYIHVKTSNTGTNWSLQPKSADIVSGGGGRMSNSFTYNNYPYVFYYASNNLYYADWDGSSWSTSSTGILQHSGGNYAFGADAIYYNGQWQMLAGEQLYYLNHYTGTFPNTWSKISTIETGSYQFTTISEFYSSLAVLDGTLHVIYKDNGCDLQWQTYNGASWTDKGVVGGDSLNLGGGTSESYRFYSCSMTKDPVSQQLACVYINTSGDLMYRVTNNLTSWSEPQLILSKGIYDIRHPHIEYVDHRLVVSFTYNLRGNYNVYTVTSPSYSGSVTGLNYTMNRIQWPDASPSDTFINSSIFRLRNINNRDIKTIRWHIADLGEIAAASNFAVHTNMSGAWNNIGVCDANGNLTVLDISGEMYGGGEWISGNYTWWKIEIQDVGAVNEDLHATDEDIWYRITFV